MLEQEKGSYAYGYDAFGNRIWKEESRGRYSYQYNYLKQIVSERQRRFIMLIQTRGIQQHPVCRKCEKQFPIGRKITYAYDGKDPITELVLKDKERILDHYTYLYSCRKKYNV